MHIILSDTAALSATPEVNKDWGWPSPTGCHRDRVSASAAAKGKQARQTRSGYSQMRHLSCMGEGKKSIMNYETNTNVLTPSPVGEDCAAGSSIACYRCFHLFVPCRDFQLPARMRAHVRTTEETAEQLGFGLDEVDNGGGRLRVPLA